MQIEINYTQSAGKNAENKYKGRNRYLEKIKGIDKAIEITKTKSKKINIESKKIQIEKKEIKPKEWYEKFKWFYTQNNFLVLAGRDAKNNEMLVKKHFTENDLYFHADIHGAPHTLLLNPEKKEIPQTDKEEAASFSAIHSSAWKNQIFSVDVYSVGFGQVTKTAKSGESLKTGAFVINGKREYFRKLDLTLGVFYNDSLQKIIVAPLSSFKSQKNIIKLVPGDIKKSEIAKTIKEHFQKKEKIISLEEIISLLPSGNFKITN